MVVVILISAAPGGGVPGSRLIGSAFDPATSEVAVSRQHRRIVAMDTADDARPALPLAGAGDLGAAVLPTFASLDFAMSPPLRFAHSHATFAPRSLTNAHGARAPPSA